MSAHWPCPQFVQVQSRRRSGSSFRGHTSYQLSQSTWTKTAGVSPVAVHASHTLLSSSWVLAVLTDASASSFIRWHCIHQRKEGGVMKSCKEQAHYSYFYNLIFFLYSEIIQAVCCFCMALGYELFPCASSTSSWQYLLIGILFLGLILLHAISFCVLYFPFCFSQGNFRFFNPFLYQAIVYLEIQF